MGLFSWIGEQLGNTRHQASKVAWEAEKEAARNATKLEATIFKEGGTATKMVQTYGKFKGDAVGTTLGGLGKIGKGTKLLAGAAILTGGLAAIGLASRKNVTAESVQDDELTPEELAAVSPAANGTPVPEEPVLGNTMMGEQPVTDGRWAQTVREGGPQGPEKLASAPTPSIASDLGAEDVSAKDGYSLGA